MPWEARTNKAGNYGRPRKLGDTKLYSIFMTNYERNTETGEVRPTKSANHKGAHYIEVPKDDPRFVESEAFGAKNELGIPFTHRDNSNKTFLLVGYLDSDGKMQSSGNAGADLEKDYGKYNSGKQPAYTTGLLQFAETQTVNGEATLLNTIEGITPVDSDGIPIADAEGTVGIDETAELASEEKEEEDTNTPASIQPIDTIKAKSEKTGFPSKGAIFKYPSALIEDDTDYIKIGLMKYKPIGNTSKLIRSRSDNALDSSANIEDSLGFIILPIPSNIQDANSVKFTDGSMDPITSAAAGLALQTIESGSAKDPIKQVQEAFANSGKTIGGLIKDETLQKVVTNSFAAQALNALPGVSVTRDQLLARANGAILNPNKELLFNGVTLRTFRFSFKLTPRSDTESKSIKNIIRVFKRNMAPKVSVSNSSETSGFLLTPNVFNLQYMKGGDKHPFLNSFKSCALTDMSVNYTGDGTYATYADATPVSMVMDLTFRELEAIYDTDYDKVPDTEGVGF